MCIDSSKAPYDLLPNSIRLIQCNGILDELKPAQIILVDKGDNDRDLFYQKYAFWLPKFRSIASVKIRIENALRKTKEYKT